MMPTSFTSRPGLARPAPGSGLAYRRSYPLTPGPTSYAGRIATAATYILLMVMACLLAGCRATATVGPATATARARRVIAQATALARNLREAAFLHEKQATATAQERLDRRAQVSTWPVVLADTFDNNANEWIVGEQTGEYADATFTLADGVYYWTTTAHQGFLWWNHPNISAVTDFYLAVDTRLVDGPASSYVGVVFRLDGSGNYYLFCLNNVGEYFLDAYYNAQWLALIPSTPSPAIRIDTTNQVEVVAEGARLSFFINGAWITDFEDATIPAGYSGLVAGMVEVGESAAWEFDNLTLRAMTTIEETPTPEATARP